MQSAMCGLGPQNLAARFQPVIECFKIREGWHHQPETVARIADVLLDLPAAIGLEPMAHQWLAPPCGWIAELGLKDIMACPSRACRHALPGNASKESAHLHRILRNARKLVLPGNGPIQRLKLWLKNPRPQIFSDRVARQPRPPCNLANRHFLAQCPKSNNPQKSHVHRSEAPRKVPQGARLHMGQFSVTILAAA